MNYRQKLGYTALGAVIMLVGMSVDTLISRPVVAGNRFGTIECDRLVVVDDAGRPEVSISEYGISLLDDRGESALFIYHDEDKAEVGIKLGDLNAERSIELTASKDYARITLSDSPTPGSTNLIDLYSRVGWANRLDIQNVKGDPGVHLLASAMHGNLITVQTPGWDDTSSVRLLNGNDTDPKIEIDDHHGELIWQAP